MNIIYRAVKRCNKVNEADVNNTAHLTLLNCLGTLSQ